MCIRDSVLSRQVKIPKGQETILTTTVSHHPHGDWLLRVRVDGKIISEKAVSPRTTKDEWLTHAVDLSGYAGKNIELELENYPSGWRNEWAYWHSVTLNSKALLGKSN